MTDAAEALRSAAAALAAARIEEAQAFLMAKSRHEHVTDGMAARVAIVETGDQVTRAQAEYEIALARVRRGD